MHHDPADETQAEVLRFFTDSFIRHLKAVSDWATTTLYRAVQERGHGGIRRTHELVLVPMKLEGARLTDIAQASAVTKNAIGQLASELETLGYVRREDHPEDGRAKLLRFTDRGLGFLADAMAANAGIEQAVAEMIGADKARQLGVILAELTAEIRARGAPSG